MKACVEKAGIDPKEIDDVMCGCAFPEGKQGLNIVRIAGQMAGFPESVSGAMVNRFCASWLGVAAHIQLGWSDVTMGAGVESMTIVPMGGRSPRPRAEYAL